MDARVLPPQHLDHMKLFIKWWRQEKSTSKFIDKTIFRIVGSGQLHDADSCYLDKPSDRPDSTPFTRNLEAVFLRGTSFGQDTENSIMKVSAILPSTVVSLLNYP